MKILFLQHIYENICYKYGNKYYGLWQLIKLIVIILLSNVPDCWNL